MNKPKGSFTSISPPLSGGSTPATPRASEPGIYFSVELPKYLCVKYPSERVLFVVPGKAFPGEKARRWINKNRDGWACPLRLSVVLSDALEMEVICDQLYLYV